MCSPVNVYGMLVKARRLSHQSLHPHWQAHVLDQAGRAGEGGLIVTGFRVVSASAASRTESAEVPFWTSRNSWPIAR